MSILTNIYYTDVIKGDVCVCRYVELPHYYFGTGAPRWHSLLLTLNCPLALTHWCVKFALCHPSLLYSHAFCKLFDYTHDV